MRHPRKLTRAVTDNCFHCRFILSINCLICKMSEGKNTHHKLPELVLRKHKYIQLTVIKKTAEKQQIITFEKLKPVNVWLFLLLEKLLKQLSNYQNCWGL